MRDLKDYIVKLNDRNIQRQRETGFTLYAILGSIVFCFFYLIDNISFAINILKDSKFLNIAVFTSNAVFIFSLFYLSYSTATRRLKLTKIFPYQQPFKIEINDYPIFISYLTICILNIKLLNQHLNNFQIIFICTFGTLTGLNIITPLIIKVYGQIKRYKKKKKGLSIEELDFTFFNKRVIHLFSVSFLIYGTILSLYWIFVSSKVEFSLDAKNISEISKYIIIYFSAIYLIKKAMDIKIKENDNNQLEDFEKEIFFENISNEMIAKKFERDFDGIPFSKWIIEKESEIRIFFEQKRNIILEQDILFINLDVINNLEYPHEYSGRLQVIVNNQGEIIKDTIDFVQKVAGTFNNLKNFSSLNDEEIIKLNFVQKTLNQNINNFNTNYLSFSQEIISRQNKLKDKNLKQQSQLAQA